jgi:membrane protein implicated in regulation of membrane protease activity
MIDWFGVAHNAAWVLGLAVILTAFAMASFLLPFGVGLFLFCLGVLFGSHTWWQRVLWGLLAVLTAGQVFWLWRDRNGERMGRGQETPEVSRSNTSDGTSIEERE